MLCLRDITTVLLRKRTEIKGKISWEKDFCVVFSRFATQIYDWLPEHIVIGVQSIGLNAFPNDGKQYTVCIERIDDWIKYVIIQ